MSRSRKSRYSFRDIRLLMVCCCLQAGANGILVNCAGLFFLPVSESLKLSVGRVSFYLTITNLSSVFFLPFAGRLIEKFPLRKVLLITSVMAASSFGIMAVYSQIWQWYISGLIIGLSGAVLYYLAVPTIIMRLYSGDRGTAVGFAASFAGISGALLNPIGTIILQNVGWRYTYGILGLVSFMLMVPTIYYLLREPDKRSCASDIDGKKKSDNEINVGNDYGWILLFVIGGSYALIAAFNSHIPAYAATVGLTAEVGGWLMSLSMIGNVVLKFLFGAMSDKIGLHKTFYLYFFASCLAVAGLILTGRQLVFGFLGSFLFGTMLSMTAVGMPLLTQHFYDGDNYSKVYSRISSGMGLFGAIGVGGAGVFYDVTGRYQMALALYLIILGFAGWTGYGLLRRYENRN